MAQSPAARQRPIGFRKEAISVITKNWKSSISTAVIGVGSAGKTNLIQHMLDPKVTQHYLGDDAKIIIPIVIDANMLGSLPAPNAPKSEMFRCWAGYELLMHRLFMAFYPFTAYNAEDAGRFYEAYQHLQDGNNPLFEYMSLRYFEFGLSLLLRQNIKIVFIFDEFEELIRQMPTKFFQTLRGVRDLYKSQLSFMTFARAPLPALIARYNVPAMEIESFIELFNDNVIYLGPYNDADAKQMLDELSTRNQAISSDAALFYLREASGQYAGLMRAGFSEIIELTSLNKEFNNTEQLSHMLMHRFSVKTECLTIWRSLTLIEQNVLKAVAKLAPYTTDADTESAMHLLIQKRLLKLHRADNRLEINPPIFRYFVASNPETTH
jgi:hypothetical protein